MEHVKISQFPNFLISYFLILIVKLTIHRPNEKKKQNIINPISYCQYTYYSRSLVEDAGSRDRKYPVRHFDDYFIGNCSGNYY